MNTRTCEAATMATPRWKAFGLVLILTGSAAGCASPSTSGAPGPVSTTHRSTPTGSAQAIQPPVLSLANVAIEDQHAVAERIGPAGGSLTATAADGTTYALTIPADALAVDTTIGVYPVTHVAGLPTADTLAAGVQFTPDGLILRRPATLSVTLPSGATATGLSGIGWTGDGSQLHAAPVIVSGHTLTLDVFHFSGGGVGNVPLEPFGCANGADLACEVDAFEATVTHDLAQPGAHELMTKDLRGFSAVVQTAFLASQGELASSATTPPNPLDEDRFAVPYEVFVRTIEITRILLDDPGFSVEPEASRARSNAAVFVRNWFDAENEQCGNHKGDADTAIALNWAIVAMDDAMARAAAWSIATAPNRLDAETLLNDSCVQVVIDPSRHFTGTGPGTAGTIDLSVGFTIGGGSLIVRDGTHFVHVLVTYTGDSLALADTDATDGTLTVPDIRWPDGVDPVRFDVLATLVQLEGGAVVPTRLARFDRLTKHKGAAVSLPPAGGDIEVVVGEVVGTCRVFGVGTNDKATDETIDATVTASGPASLFDKPAEGTTRFTATGPGVVTFTAVANGASGQASTYVDPLAGDFESAGDQAEVSARIASDGSVSYDVHLLTSPSGGLWTGLVSEEGHLQGTDSAGHALDVTITDQHLAGTIDGAPVDFTRICGFL